VAKIISPKPEASPVFMLISQRIPGYAAWCTYN
jgi:hypothetical protein